MEVGSKYPMKVDPRLYNWGEDTTLREAIMQALGGASVCWSNPEGAGTFLSEMAIRIANELELFIVQKYIDEKIETPNEGMFK